MRTRSELVEQLELEAGRWGAAGDDHLEALLREAAGVLAISKHPTEDLQLAFQEAAPGTTGEAPGENLAGSCVIRSGSIDARHTQLRARIPVLIHTFYAPDGVTVLCQPHLVLDPPTMRAYRTLVGQSVDAAINHARKGR